LKVVMLMFDDVIGPQSFLRCLKNMCLDWLNIRNLRCLKH